MTSIAAKGTSTGYGPEGTRPIEIVAKAPGQRATIIHTLDGDNTTVYDGQSGWISAPHKPVAVLRPDGKRAGWIAARSGAVVSGTHQGDAAASGAPAFRRRSTTRRFWWCRASRPNGTLATFYFDSETGLLTRLVRYANSKVGRLPTQIDYSDYRDVAGIKMPFRIKVTWLDGLESIELTDVQLNVPVDAARFGKPAPPRK